MQYLTKIFSIFLLMCSTSYAAGVGENNLPVFHGVGGDFTLDSTLDKPASLSDFNDKMVLLSFGYTNCSDVCPVTLGFLNNTIKKLGEAADKTQVLFVSVDPDYDTIAHLQKYLAYFNDGFIGLTGDKSAIDKAVKLYNIRYSKTSDLQVSTRYRKKQIPKDDVHHGHHGKGSDHSAGHGSAHGKYHGGEGKHHDTSSLFSHSTYIYLIDLQGRVRGVFDTTTSAEKLAQSIKGYLLDNQLI
ncbi:SCO family protein [Thalassomonas sp. RHCl1]|uniref:SCO family protein n=1 Tax=Thalassomonas sp. RHCl1 TaxID=2995320 RepID=UPI00248B45F4|nr:SCO family protein [Thalassomonas sp. RHCl1]